MIAHHHTHPHAHVHTHPPRAPALLRPAQSTAVAVTGGTAAEAETDDDAEYELIVSCNEMVAEIDNEIEAIAKHIKDEYARRFPELDSLILNPLDYARVVLKLGNEIDMSEVRARCLFGGGAGVRGRWLLVCGAGARGLGRAAATGPSRLRAPARRVRASWAESLYGVS